MRCRWIRTLLLIGCAVSLCATPGLTAAEWPGLRGPDFDGAARGARLLVDDATGLSVGWKEALGPGYSSIAVGGGHVLTTFADGEEDVLAAFDVESGAEAWRYVISKTYAGHSGSHDGPLATPLIADGKVFALSAYGHLAAVDAKTGSEIWKNNLVESMEAVQPFFGFTTSPILVDGVLAVQVGAGEGKSIAGFDPADGSVKWTLGDDKVDYQSPIVAMIDGQRQLLAAGDKHLFGIDAAKGEVIWSYEHQGDGRALSSASMIPVPAGEGRFLLLNKSDSSSMIQVKAEDGKYSIEELWSSNAIRGTYVTPVYHDGFFYGISGRVTTCVDAATGETRWRSREPGDGFVTLVGDQLVIVTKPGSLHVAKASPEGYQEIAQTPLFDEHAWSEVAYANGRLFARSMGHLARIDAGAGSISLDSQEGADLGGSAFGMFLADIEQATDKSDLIDAFLDRQDSFPIVESPDLVHFVYRGEASDVGIVGDMIGFRREEPMVQVTGTDLYYFSTRLEPDAAVTYGFITDFEDPAPDPLNPRPGDGLFGEVSWLSMPAWQAPSFVAEASETRRGRIEPIEWESKVREGQTRKAEVYLPSGFDASSDRRYPTAYFFGGKDALEDGGLKNSLDNLIGDSVEPLIAVFVLPPDDENAGGDLSQIDPYGEMVVTELIPLVDSKFPTRTDPRSRAAVGAAGAGAGALYLAMKHPEVFGLAGSQAGTYFMQSETPLREKIVSVDDQPVAIYMSWGTYQIRSPHEAWDTAEDNREIFALLRERGFRPAGGETPDGHGWSCWHGQTGRMFTSLFPLQQKDPA